jgi:uncharacterized membrane protein
MPDALIFLKNNLVDHFNIYFIPLYILGGRPVAILSAQMIGIKVLFLLPVVVLLDTLQIPLFFHVYGTISNRLFVQKIQQRSSKKEKRLSNSKFFHWVQLMGIPGVVVITMLPLKGCGMWSGVLLSKALGLSKKTGYLLLIAGSIAGCIIVFGIGEAVLEFGSLLGNN